MLERDIRLDIIASRASFKSIDVFYQRYEDVPGINITVRLSECGAVYVAGHKLEDIAHDVIPVLLDEVLLV